jgi:hypothetical protein
LNENPDGKQLKRLKIQNSADQGGFNQEWASSTRQRVQQRQIEVQANDQNRPTQYRTVELQV